MVPFAIVDTFTTVTTVANFVLTILLNLLNYYISKPIHSRVEYICIIYDDRIVTITM
jgi:hypothetical protein